VYIVLIEGYNWKEKIIIALETENHIHFKIICLAKTTLILNGGSIFFNEVKRKLTDKYKFRSN